MTKQSRRRNPDETPWPWHEEPAAQLQEAQLLRQQCSAGSPEAAMAQASPTLPVPAAGRGQRRRQAAPQRQQQELGSRRGRLAGHWCSRSPPWCPEVSVPCRSGLCPIQRGVHDLHMGEQRDTHSQLLTLLLVGALSLGPSPTAVSHRESLRGRLLSALLVLASACCSPPSLEEGRL